MGWTRIALSIVTGMALSGCGWLFPQHPTEAAANGKHEDLYIVTAEQTAFYRRGPRQAHGPDRQLTKQMVVTVIRHAFAYSKVRLADGEQGFVANEDLIPASDTLVAAASDTGEQEESPASTPEVTLPTAGPSPEQDVSPLLPH